MKYGTCLLSMVPMRAKPSEPSEMVSQLLFGEQFTIDDKFNDWVHIHSMADDYAGWVARPMITLIDEPVKLKQVIDVPLMATVMLSGKRILLIPGGSIIPSQPVKDLAKEIDLDFDSLRLPRPKRRKIGIEELAEGYLGAPYLWGGKTVMGIDCSGLMQVLFRMKGIWLPRDAGQQAQIGNRVPFSEATLGDLAFFGDADSGKVKHVGLLCNQSTIIHASGYVRKDSIDSTGIFIGKKEKLYTHTLLYINRILNDN